MPLALVVVVVLLQSTHPRLSLGNFRAIGRGKNILQPLAALVLGPRMSSMQEVFERADLRVEGLPLVVDSVTGGGSTLGAGLSTEDLGPIIGNFLATAATATALVTHGEFER